MNDISLNSENSEEFRQGDLLSGAFRRRILQKLIRVEESKVYLERYWKKNWSNRITFLHRNMDPYGGIEADGAGFNYGFLANSNDVSSEVDTVIRATELIFKTRYAHDEEFLEARFTRVSAGTRFPIIELQYSLGINNFLNGDYTYHKLALSYRHYFYLNPIGWLSYRFRAGKTFGTVPFLLMEVHPGNESLFMSRDDFNLMNRYEFASDTYFSVNMEHHFDGFFFNKIPGVRKLKFRTVATFKAVVGTISDRNRQANLLNLYPIENALEIGSYTGFRAPDKRPYMEAGVGVENILKIIRVDALWRLSYLDNPEARRFTIRLGLAFYF